MESEMDTRSFNKLSKWMISNSWIILDGSTMSKWKNWENSNTVLTKVTILIITTINILNQHFNIKVLTMALKVEKITIQVHIPTHQYNLSRTSINKEDLLVETMTSMLRSLQQSMAIQLLRVRVQAHIINHTGIRNRLSIIPQGRILVVLLTTSVMCLRLIKMEILAMANISIAANNSFIIHLNLRPNNLTQMVEGIITVHQRDSNDKAHFTDMQSYAIRKFSNQSFYFSSVL